MLGMPGFIVFILGAIAVGVAYVIVLICSSAIVFSRVAFSLLAALVASSGGMELVPNDGFLNYVAWAIIFLGAVYLLSMLPRVDMALNFLCTTLMSVLVIQIVAMMLGGIFAAIQGETFQMTTLYEIVVKIICVLVSVGAMITQKKKAAYDSPTNKIIFVVEKLLAAIMYGISIAFLFVSLNGNWELNGVLLLVVFLGSTVAAFFADKYLEGKDIFGAESTHEVYIPK